MNKKLSLKSILILDDDQEFRTLLKSLLLKSFPDVEIHEYDPIEKGEPDDGFDWSVFDVLILDHYLCIHGLTGLDLFEKHQNKSDFPLTIMLTGAGNEELVIRAFKAGIKDYIRKDKLSAAVLYEAINKAYEEYLARQNAQHELQAAENQIQEGRSKLEVEVAKVNSKLESIEEEKRLQQDAKVEIRRMRSEAEEQIQKERSELEDEVVKVNSKLESIEEEKRLQQDAKEEIQRKRSEAEKHQQVAEMAEAKDEIENANKALNVAEAKLKISENENKKLETKLKQQLDKGKVEKTVSAPKEIQSGDEILDSTQLGAAMDLDELLDTEEEAQKQSDSEVKVKPVENDTSDEVLDSTQLGAEMDLGELLELEPQEQNDEVIDPDELLDPGQESDKPDNGQS
jgi:FixJ family two-component response regulator